MINTIPTIESKKENIFGEVTKRTSSTDYWLRQTPTDSVEIKDNKKNNDSKIKIMTPDEARKTNNFRAWGMSIAGATILTAAGIFFVLKGGPKGLSKNFQKLRNYLENKVQRSKLNNTAHSTANKIYLYMIQKLDTAQQKFEVINNFTTVKDMVFKKLMYNPLTGKYTGKIHAGITKMFEKIGRQSVVNTYKRTSSRFSETRAVADSLARKILSKDTSGIIEHNGVRLTKAEWLTKLNQMNADFVAEYERHFNNSARIRRYLKIKKTARDLENKFSKLRVFLSKDLVNTFMAESAIGKEKLLMQETVKGFRNNLSYSIADLAKDSDEQIMKLTQSISYKDVEKIDILRNLRRDIKSIAKVSEGKIQMKNPDGSVLTKEALNNRILKEMDRLKDSVQESLRTRSMDENTVQKLLKEVSDLRISFIGFKQGKVEDILDIYRKILSPEDYKIVEKAYRENIKYLDKSINVETEDFVNKVRDLTLGSAPTDIVTVLGSLATLGYYLGKSDNNDERASVSLKYGIPALAGIGTSLYCNAKLFAGTKSLIIGTISTLIVNKIGTWADKRLKKYQAHKREALQQPPAPQNNVLDLTASASQVKG